MGIGKQFSKILVSSAPVHKAKSHVHPASVRFSTSYMWPVEIEARPGAGLAHPLVVLRGTRVISVDSGSIFTYR